MKKTLDQSHRTVLENLETFNRAEQCVDEIEQYLRDILEEITRELPAGDDLKVQFILQKNEWLQINPLPNWQDTSIDLLYLGIQHFALNDLLGLEEGHGCSAYIYSHLLADSQQLEKYAHVWEYLRGLKPPDGFSSSPFHRKGYLFEKMLEPISVETFCSRDILKAHLSSPLLQLVDWFAQNRNTIVSLPRKA